MYEQIEEYINFSEQINDYISAIMVAKNICYKEYDSSLVWECIKEKGVTIRGFPFEGVAKNRISGMIVQDGAETTIGYNQNMTAKRRNFTISHEMIHFLYHIDEENQIFTDTEENISYSNNEMICEFQANIGASAILIPDVVLFRLLKEGWNLPQLSTHYGISESAIYVRLVQTMQAHFGVSFISAKKNADAIRYKYYGQGKKAAIRLGENLENQLLRTNRFIEAL